MGVIYADTEQESYWDIPEEHREAVDNAMSALGCDRFGNESLDGYEAEGALVRVKVQMGSGTELDLSDPSVEQGIGSRPPRVWHYNAMMEAARVVRVADNGWVTLLVRVRY